MELSQQCALMDGGRFNIEVIRSRFKQLEDDLDLILGRHRETENNDQNTSETTLTNKNNVVYKCEECQKVFKSRFHLNGHMNYHRGVGGTNIYRCQSCDYACHKVPQLERHVRETHTGEQFYCSVCEKRFGTRAGLFYHSWTHTTEKPYQCPQCNASFTKKRALTVHIARTHGLVEVDQKIVAEVTCEFCHKILANRQNYLVHIRMHTGERPLKCEYCSKTFRDPSNFNSHKKYHENKYECEVCGCCFDDEVKLSEHDCNVNDRKTFDCNFCGDVIVGNKSFRKHVKRHRDNGVNTPGSEHILPCAQCEKTFKSKRGLQQHTVREHSGKSSRDLRFKCAICGVSYASSSSLLRHVSRRHFGKS